MMILLLFYFSTIFSLTFSFSYFCIFLLFFLIFIMFMLPRGQATTSPLVLSSWPWVHWDGRHKCHDQWQRLWCRAGLDLWVSFSHLSQVRGHCISDGTVSHLVSGRIGKLWFKTHMVPGCSNSFLVEKIPGPGTVVLLGCSNWPPVKELPGQGSGVVSIREQGSGGKIHKKNCELSRSPRGGLYWHTFYSSHRLSACTSAIKVS